MRLLKKWGGKRIESHAVAVGQRFERYFRCASKTRKGFCHTIPPPVDAANHFQTIGGRISNLGASEHYIPEWIQFFPRNQKYSSNPKSDNKWSGRPDRWCQLTFCSGSDSESSSIWKIAPFFLSSCETTKIFLWSKKKCQGRKLEIGIVIRIGVVNKKDDDEGEDSKIRLKKSSKQIEIYFWSDSDSFAIAKYSTCQNQILFSSLGDFLSTESESE